VAPHCGCAFFEDYRYSADLDFSLIGGLDQPGALQAVAMALAACRQALGLPQLSLTDATPPRIEYMGPLGRSRTLKLDLADDELVENVTHRTVLERKARHRQLDPSLFPTRFEERLPQYKARWTNELSDHVAGDPPQFEELLRAVRRALRDSLRRR
jgi:hypothetical protein